MDNIDKICCVCRKSKSINEYHRDKTRSDGLSSKCKVCIRNRDLVRYATNKQIINKCRVKNNKLKILNDPLYKIKESIRCLIKNSYRRKSNNKTTKTAEILGCSVNEFKHYIEQKFQSGMTWDNYGKWHFDHVKPVSLATTPEDLVALNHYTNFQPLWAEDNIKKSDHYEQTC